MLRGRTNLRRGLLSLREVAFDGAETRPTRQKPGLARKTRAVPRPIANYFGKQC